MYSLKMLLNPLAATLLSKFFSLVLYFSCRPLLLLPVLTFVFKCNCFNGQLPSTLGQLDRLWSFTVRDNNFSGRVRALTTDHVDTCSE